MQEFLAFMQHHALLSIALIAALLLLFILEFIRLKQSARQLSPAEATRLINRQDAIVIDLRSVEAFDNGHIVGAVSLPDIKNATTKLVNKYKNQPIILVCSNGLESSKIAPQLKEQGLMVYVLAQGLQSWKNAELPLVKKG